MAEARFLIVAGTVSAHHRWVRWPDRTGSHVERLGPDGSWYAWRLTAGNNRELGRSAGVFAEPGACLTAMAALPREIGRAVPCATVDDATGLWAWRLELDGRPVAVAARRYYRQRECQYNLAHFLTAVAIARLPPSKAKAQNGSPAGSRVAAPELASCS